MGEQRRKQEAERKAESERILERVRRDSETVGSSAFARTTTRLADHFLARDAPQDDPVEIVGKRIGRVLSVIFFIGLVIYLFMAYVVN